MIKEISKIKNNEIENSAKRYASKIVIQKERGRERERRRERPTWNNYPTAEHGKITKCIEN